MKYVVSIPAPKNKFSVVGKKETKKEAEALKKEMEKQGFVARIVKTKRHGNNSWT